VRFQKLALVLLALAGAARAQESDAEKSALEEMLEPDDEAAQRPEESAHVAEISDELTFGSAQVTSDSPRQQQIANALRGTFYASEAVTLTVGFTFTADEVSPHASFSRVDYGAKAAFFAVGADWDIDDHFTVDAHVEASPEWQQFSAVQVPYPPTPSRTAELLLRSHSSSLGGGGSITYDTAGSSDLESAFQLGASVTRLAVDDRVTRAQTEEGAALTLQEVRTNCGCTATLKAVLGEHQASVLQTRLSGLLIETVAMDTDLSLGADYYLYSDDPTQVGPPPRVLTSTISGGGGAPIAPLHWTIRPEVAHRFGQVTARAWAQIGRYVENAGQGTGALGLKLQYKFSKSFRMWARLLGSRDVDDQGNETKSGAFSLGAGYRF